MFIESMSMSPSANYNRLQNIAQCPVYHAHCNQGSGKLNRTIVEKNPVIDRLASASVSSPSQAIAGHIISGWSNERTPWCLALQGFMDASMAFRTDYVLRPSPIATWNGRFRWRAEAIGLDKMSTISQKRWTQLQAFWLGSCSNEKTIQLHVQGYIQSQW